MPDPVEDAMDAPEDDAPVGVDATFVEPVVGWRMWRIRKVETLGGEQPLRLAAAGRLGVPKFWEPRAANRAICSDYRTTHEAPWPDCRCGIYAFRTSEAAEEALQRYTRGKLSGWALGRVSLWGRVVECENGWRAQYGYPYDLAVFSDDEAVAAEIRDVYAVDVTRVDPPPVPASRGAAKRRAKEGEKLNAQTQALYEAWLKGWTALIAEKLASASTTEEFRRSGDETVHLRVKGGSRTVVVDLSVLRKMRDQKP